MHADCYKQPFREMRFTFAIFHFFTNSSAEGIIFPLQDLEDSFIPAINYFEIFSTFL
jgi:hypothetical protein